MLRLLLCCVLLALAACSKPQPPEKERPVEPKAPGAVVQAINAPLDKAKGVQDTLDKAAEQQDAEIDRQSQ
jgi:hypothetical protein